MTITEQNLLASTNCVLLVYGIPVPGIFICLPKKFLPLHDFLPSLGTTCKILQNLFKLVE